MPTEEQMKDQAQQQQGQPQGQEQKQGQGGPGEPSPGIKDREARTSDSYGNTRESGETPK